MMILLLLLSFYFYNYFTREPNSPEGALLTVSLENDVDKHKKRHLNLMQNTLLYNAYHRWFYPISEKSSCCMAG